MNVSSSSSVKCLTRKEGRLTPLIRITFELPFLYLGTYSIIKLNNWSDFYLTNLLLDGQKTWSHKAMTFDFLKVSWCICAEKKLSNSNVSNCVLNISCPKLSSFSPLFIGVLYKKKLLKNFITKVVAPRQLL